MISLTFRNHKDASLNFASVRCPEDRGGRLLLEFSEQLGPQNKDLFASLIFNNISISWKLQFCMTTCEAVLGPFM